MALLSPGVEIKEIDASTIVPTISDSTGLFQGNFVRGPVQEKVLITNPDDLVQIFGEPTETTYNQFYQAWNFLQYQNTMFITRTETDDMYSSTGGLASDGILEELDIYDDTNYNPNDPDEDDIIDKRIKINNQTDFESTHVSDGGALIRFIQSTPGSWGNDIQIQIGKEENFSNDDYAFEGITFNRLFDYQPEDDLLEIQVAIKYEDEIERFLVSLNEDSKDSMGKQNFIETIINRQSDLVYVVLGSDSTNPDDLSIIESCFFTPQTGTDPQIDGTIKLFTGNDGGTDGVPNRSTKGQIAQGYEIYDNVEEIDIDIVIGNEVDENTQAINLADARRDCIQFVGVSEGVVVGFKAVDATKNIVNWRNIDFQHNTMFQCLAGNYKYQYDRFQDKNRWINIQGDIQGLRAQTNTRNASWWASAGLERGQIKNVLKLAFIPNQAQRDDLYKKNINPVTQFPGLGTVMWGQKTLQTKPSSFDRVNVRNLFNIIERSLARMSRYQVFEFNDDFTRNRILQMIRPFLETVQAGRGIQDFLVVCDTSNNTPDVISRNQLVIDVYIKPTYVAEFITLRFTNQGVNDFSTVVSS